MGFKAVDITPLGPYGPTVLTPSSKEIEVKLFQITRSDTTSTAKCYLPADSTIVDFLVFSTAVSNAGTTAVINVGNASSATNYINGLDVKTNAGKLAITTQAQNWYNLENIPLGPDIAIYGQYAETGTASSSGGPYYVLVKYVR